MNVGIDLLNLEHGSCEAVWKEEKNGWDIFPSNSSGELVSEINSWLESNGMIFTILLKTRTPNYIFARKKPPVMR
jgi:hypothetical protein